MIILCLKFKSEHFVLLISICSLIIGIDVRQRSCIFNNEIVFTTIWYFLNISMYFFPLTREVSMSNLCLLTKQSKKLVALFVLR